MTARVANLFLGLSSVHFWSRTNLEFRQELDKFVRSLAAVRFKPEKFQHVLLLSMTRRSCFAEFSRKGIDELPFSIAVSIRSWLMTFLLLSLNSFACSQLTKLSAAINRFKAKHAALTKTTAYRFQQFRVNLFRFKCFSCDDIIVLPSRFFSKLELVFRPQKSQEREQKKRWMKANLSKRRKWTTFR